MTRYRLLIFGFLSVTLFLLSPQVHAECFSSTEDFNPATGYSWNNPWTHCVPDLPPGCVVESAEISVRAKVWYWGGYPYKQDILASDTIEFNFSSGYVCTIDPATHPSSSRFYTVTCELQPDQLEWLTNDNCINFMMVTYGGTYYLDSSTIDVCCAEVPECAARLDSDSDVDGSDLYIFSHAYDEGDITADLDDSGAVDANDLAVFAADFGRTDCPL